ncbi:MAG: hypothetical protein EZS28_005427 [Streblomastix strix]|uniref:Uncharacterized protein n=1 Tax=Streblomastix strix TaxID=222440 RepID=A0A5J4WX06_9EUKA|nr:MAG: hypothetical protein EZS28_005427 [Streblomastix strix]
MTTKFTLILAWISVVEYDSHLGTLFSQMSIPGRQLRASNQSFMKLISKQPTSRRQRIAPLTQKSSQSEAIPYLNLNQSSILNVDLMGIITNPFSVPKGMQHQQMAGDSAQVFHAPGETFSINGNAKRVASSTGSIVSGQVGVAGTKPTHIQTSSSIQFQ